MYRPPYKESLYGDPGRSDWKPVTARYLIGDVLEVLPTLEAASVDLILTSPPFLALRSYLPSDHPLKAKEGGSQSTPGAFIDWLVDVVEALDRVLAPHGSMVIELGDTYAGSGGAGGDYDGSGLRAGQPKFRQGYFDPARGRAPRAADDYAADSYVASKGGSGWPADKSLTLIPELFRMTLVYGFNPLTGRQTKRWRLRNVIRWVRPNPPVGALGDKFRPATSELMVFCRTDEAGRRRYFDLDAVREAQASPWMERYANTPFDRKKDRLTTPNVEGSRDGFVPAGAPPLDWWNIPLLPCDTCGGSGYGGDGGHTYNNQEEYEGIHEHQCRQCPVPCPSCGGSGKQGATPYGPGEKPKSHARTAKGVESAPRSAKSANRGGNWATLPELHETQGSPPLDWWNIPPGGYQGAHYAVFPEALCVRPIKAMCPEKVCRTCGEPSRRASEPANTNLLGSVIHRARLAVGLSQKDVAAWFPSISGGLTGCVWNWENGANVPTRDQWHRLKTGLDIGPEFDYLLPDLSTIEYIPHGDPARQNAEDYAQARMNQNPSAQAMPLGRATKVNRAGVTDCGHDNYRPGLVLDPFAGSGTTLAVAVGHGRDAIGIDLDERNARLAEERIGFFLEVVQ